LRALVASCTNAVALRETKNLRAIAELAHIVVAALRARQVSKFIVFGRKNSVVSEVKHLPIITSDWLALKRVPIRWQLLTR